MTYFALVNKSGKSTLISDDETIDGIADGSMSHNVQWKCRYEDSLIQPSRVVLDINMGNLAAGNR